MLPTLDNVKEPSTTHFYEPITTVSLHLFLHSTVLTFGSSVGTYCAVEEAACRFTMPATRVHCTLLLLGKYVRCI